MTMRCIGIVLLLAAGALSAAGDNVIYRSQSGVGMEYTSTLRRLESFLKEIFPQSPYRKNPLTVRITGKGTPFEEESGHFISVNCFDIDNGNLETVARVGAAILNAHGKAPAGFKLPLFIAGAFRYRERAAQNECRFLGNNRRLNSVEALLRYDTVPDFKKILDVRDDGNDHVQRLWYDEHARLILEMLRRSGFRGRAEEIFSAAEKLTAQKFSASDLYPVVWNNFNPLPPHLIRKILDLLLQCDIPKLDYQNNPTSIVENVRITEVPAKLKQHPMRKEILFKFAGKILQEAASLPISMRYCMRKLHDAAKMFGNDQEKEELFLEAVRELELNFQLIRKRTQALDNSALKDLQPVKSHFSAIKANARSGGLMTPECQRCLDRCEEYFSRF